MAAVGGTAQHGVEAIDLLGEKHAVAVEGEEGILTLIEGLEVEGVANADGGLALVAVAPGNPVAVFNPSDAGVVFIRAFDVVSVATFKFNGVVIDVPVNAVF